MKDDKSRLAIYAVGVVVALFALWYSLSHFSGSTESPGYKVPTPDNVNQNRPPGLAGGSS